MLLAKGEDFQLDAHRQVYEVMRDLHSRGEPIHPAGVAAGISHLEEHQAAGRSGFLAELAGRIPHAANGKYYWK